VNSVYFDNSSMELYHGRLDKRPNAIALRIRSPPPTPLPPHHPSVVWLADCSWRDECTRRLCGEGTPYLSRMTAWSLLQ